VTSHVVMRLLIAGMAHMMGSKTTEMTVSQYNTVVRVKRVLNGKDFPDRER
jgi:hypothetical protein